MRDRLEAVAAWFKRWGWWLMGALLALATLGAAGGFGMRYLGKLRDEKQLADARVELERLRVLRAQVAERRGEADNYVQIIDSEIKRQKRLVVSSFEGGAGLSDEDLEAAFREALGG